ncbi:MgtC/SapB transporter [Halothece sp. PCC 7418]|uniref:MgtC/SapB family protein n=1 Tax=Halothece sp. (strain PCC 7418) TaxID=65093 RepID=UPI0002A0829F|nr:MgtC/SapB family protein [Halothece sp. PCC 7418]AFZ44676.1 MgtC/SapB transporter [Halothece sp. PCC 7418]
MIDPVIAILSPIPWSEAAGRLILAVIFGGIIGWDRERDRKSAGLRTNMLVSLGAALVILGGLQSGIGSRDESLIGRSIQGILTGVGFVGAGAILQRDKVHGLTTATAIWISSALGIVSGLGLWQLGLMGLGLTMIILRVMKLVEK